MADGTNHRIRRRVQTPVGTKTRTKQSEADSTDVNRIMAKYLKTGVIEHWNQRRPQYGDFSAATDYKTAVDTAQAAQDEFMTLSANVRKACENDPLKLLELMASEEGMQTLVDAGLELDDSKANAGAPPAPKKSEEAVAADAPLPPSTPPAGGDSAT